MLLLRGRHWLWRSLFLEYELSLLVTRTWQDWVEQHHGIEENMTFLIPWDSVWYISFSSPAWWTGTQSPGHDLIDNNDNTTFPNRSAIRLVWSVRLTCCLLEDDEENGREQLENRGGMTTICITFDCYIRAEIAKAGGIIYSFLSGHEDFPVGMKQLTSVLWPAIIDEERIMSFKMVFRTK